jgi:hypothetical protein
MTTTNARDAGYNAALRQVANRLVGIPWLPQDWHPYDEATTWPPHRNRLLNTNYS